MIDERFARARELATELPELPGCRYRVELRLADGRVWHEHVVDGRFASWGPGPVDDPDLVLAVGSWLADRLYDPDLDGTAALEVVRVIDGEGTERQPSPLDFLETVEITGLPAIPGADLVSQYHLAAGPFGAVDAWMSFRDGRLEDAELGTVDERDVEVWITWDRMARLRTGEITVLEALEHGGRVDGEVGPLMLLAGLHESPEMRAADLAAGRSAPVLSMMGRLRASPAFRDLLTALAAETEP